MKQEVPAHKKVFMRKQGIFQFAPKIKKTDVDNSGWLGSSISQAQDNAHDKPPFGDEVWLFLLKQIELECETLTRMKGISIKNEFVQKIISLRKLLNPVFPEQPPPSDGQVREYGLHRKLINREVIALLEEIETLQITNIQVRAGMRIA